MAVWKRSRGILHNPHDLHMQCSQPACVLTSPTLLESISVPQFAEASILYAAALPCSCCLHAPETWSTHLSISCRSSLLARRQPYTKYEPDVCEAFTTAKNMFTLLRVSTRNIRVEQPHARGTAVQPSRVLMFGFCSTLATLAQRVGNRTCSETRCAQYKYSTNCN